MQIVFVETSEKLEQLVSDILLLDEISVDLEFDKNRYRYGFNLCLIQICCGNETCFLIDPLSDKLNIDILFPVLEDKNIQKVVFAFGEDLRLLHTLDCFPVNIYDCSNASALLNYPPQSLTNLLFEVLGIEPEKSSQRSNWYKRPLTDEQCHYASNDVLHLLHLKEKLTESAINKGINSWIEDENKSIELLDYSDLDGNEFLKEKDKKGLNEIEWHLFKRLMEFREAEAKRYNRPSYQIMDKNLVLKLVRNKELMSTWSDLKGIYRPLRNRKTARQLELVLESASNEVDSLDLSGSKPAEKRPDKKTMDSRRKSARRADQIKKAFLIPVKTMIGDDYGEDAANFIFSNRIMNDFLTGNSVLESYKADLLRDYSKRIRINYDIYPELKPVLNP